MILQLIYPTKWRTKLCFASTQLCLEKKRLPDFRTQNYFKVPFSIFSCERLKVIVLFSCDCYAPVGKNYFSQFIIEHIVLKLLVAVR